MHTLIQGVFLSRDLDPKQMNKSMNLRSEIMGMLLEPSWCQYCHFSWLRFQKGVLNFSKVPQMNPLVYSNLQCFLFKACKYTKAFQHTLKDIIWVISSILWMLSFGWMLGSEDVKVSVHWCDCLLC